MKESDAEKMKHLMELIKFKSKWNEKKNGLQQL